MALNNDFRTSRRTFNEKGGFFGLYTGVDSLYTGAGSYSINTNSHILSAGVNLLNIFALSGAVASSSVYTTVNTNSANWSNAYTTTNATSSVYTITNTNSANWSNAYTNSNATSSVYTTTNTNSANWSNAYTTTNATSSVYTTTNANSAAWSSVFSAYNSVSGNIYRNTASAGTNQGQISIPKLNGVPDNVNINGLQTGSSPQFVDLTLTGNLSVLGDFSILNTTVSVTSALSVVNTGSGPALYVRQTGSQPIAYYDGAEPGSTIVFSDSGYIGLGDTGSGLNNPAARLTVAGVISSSNVIYASGGNSNLWNSVYSYVTGASANYILDGGNLKGTPITIGTRDAQNLNLETNDTTKLTILPTGNVGIGTQTPAALLTVAGNILATGGATLSGAKLTSLAQTGITTANRYVTVDPSDGTLAYDAIPAGTALIDGFLVNGLQNNRLTKSSSTVTTLTASTLVDTGSSVQIDRNVSFIQTAADSSNVEVQVVRQVFTSPVTTSTSFLSTFPMTIPGFGGQINLMYSRHNVLFYEGLSGRRTAFEIVAGNFNSAGSVNGTVFGIIDIGTTTLLNDVDITNTGNVLILNLTSTATCKAIIESIAYYGNPV